MRTAIIAFFAVLFAVLVALAPACATVLAETIPLAWRDTGYTILPGYTVTASLHAEVLNLPFTWDIAKAGVQCGDIVVMTEASRTWSDHVKVYLVVRQGGEELLREEIADLGFGTGMPVDASIEFKANCDGSVQVIYRGEVVASFTIQDEGAAIYKFTERRSDGLWSLQSQVTLTRRGSGCGLPSTTTTAQLPPEPTPEPDTNHLMAGVGHALTTAATAGVVVVVVGLGLLLVYIVYSQAKKRKLVR